MLKRSIFVLLALVLSFSVLGIANAQDPSGNDRPQSDRPVVAFYQILT